MRKDRLTRQVRKAYRQNMLAQILTLGEEKFGAAFGMETVQTNGPAGADYYHFRDNGSNVLAVAHLDTVVGRGKRKPHFYETDKGPAVRSGALDDRLGAYVILGLLPRLGITTDILLTVGEEWGESTAIDFTPGKQYDWVIEFDRAGTDVVMYQYEDAASCVLVEEAGAPVGWGSFSDIAYLEHLGVKAFNWGVGYAGNYHSCAGYAPLNDTFAMVAKYVRFHRQNAGTLMKHVPSPAWGSGFNVMADCLLCDSKGTVDYATMVCDECGFCTDCTEQAQDCQCYTPASAGRRDQEEYCPDCRWPTDACACEPGDAVAGARAAWAGDGWAGGVLALDAARDADSGAIGYAEARQRIEAGRLD